MDARLIAVPYDSGQRAYRMGRGPEHFLQSGLARTLDAGGVRTDVVMVESTERDPLDSAFDLAAKIARAVQDAERAGQLPVILAGNCAASLGGFAGLASRSALLWLDAHGDFNTPDTSPSGFLDGMTLAIMTGRCFTERSRALPGFVPLADAQLVMLGTRDLDPAEQAICDHIRRAQNSTQLRACLAAVASDQLYLHVDLDVLDPAELTANSFAAPAGLTRDSLMECIRLAASTKRIAALAITAYDPAADATKRGPGVVADIITTVLAPR